MLAAALGGPAGEPLGGREAGLQAGTRDASPQSRPAQRGGVAGQVRLDAVVPRPLGEGRWGDRDGARLQEGADNRDGDRGPSNADLAQADSMQAEPGLEEATGAINGYIRQNGEAGGIDVSSTSSSSPRSRDKEGRAR